MKHFTSPPYCKKCPVKFTADTVAKNLPLYKKTDFSGIMRWHIGPCIFDKLEPYISL